VFLFCIHLGFFLASQLVQLSDKETDEASHDMLSEINEALSEKFAKLNQQNSK